MRLSILSLPILLTGCVGTPHHADLAAPAPVFSPTAFFAGDSQGRATLTELFSGTKPVHVTSHGVVTPDGTLVLDQVVERADKKPEHREWRIREVAPGHFAGTLSDATGPVRGDVHGNCLHLRFKMKGGLQAEQWLYLQPGGRTALNRMAIRKFGITVAALRETITRGD